MGILNINEIVCLCSTHIGHPKTARKLFLLIGKMGTLKINEIVLLDIIHIARPKAAFETLSVYVSYSL